MPINAVPVTILDQSGAIGATGPTTPVITGDLGLGVSGLAVGDGAGSERTRGMKRVLLNVGRNDDAGGALAGAFALWGAEPSDVGTGQPLGNAFATPGTPTTQAFTAFVNTDGAASPLVGQANLNTEIPFVAFSNNNWLVAKNGVLLAQGAGAGKFTVTNNGGFARIVLGTNVATNDQYAVYFVTPVQLMADGAHSYENVSILSRTVMWTNWSTDQGAADRTVVTINHLAE
jgi:hypothetical protein